MDREILSEPGGKQLATQERPTTPVRHSHTHVHQHNSAGVRFIPRWVGQFLGRETLRVCPEAAKSDPCEGCALRVLCKCAQEDWESACRVERRVWMVIIACSAAVMGYALLR